MAKYTNVNSIGLYDDRDREVLVCRACGRLLAGVFDPKQDQSLYLPRLPRHKYNGAWCNSGPWNARAARPGDIQQ